MAAPQPVHPPIPLGWGSYIGLTGISGAIATFLIAWGENHWHMTAPISVLGIGAVAAVVSFAQSRSHQAAALIAKVEHVMGEVGIAVTPPVQAITVQSAPVTGSAATTPTITVQSAPTPGEAAPK